MQALLHIDWDKLSSSVFVADQSLLEIFLRGTIMYLLMFVLLRVFRRQAGSISISDLLVIVVIADAAQNGMAGTSHTVTEAVLLILTIIFWNYVIDWLGFESKLMARVFEAKRLVLVSNGRIIHENMRRELLTRGDLLMQMRERGIEHLSEIKEAALESDGHFSFLTFEMGERRDATSTSDKA